VLVGLRCHSLGSGHLSCDGCQLCRSCILLQRRLGAIGTVSSTCHCQTPPSVSHGPRAKLRNGVERGPTVEVSPLHSKSKSMNAQVCFRQLSQPEAIPASCAVDGHSRTQEGRSLGAIHQPPCELFDGIRRIPARPLQGREHELDLQPRESRRIPVPAPVVIAPFRLIYIPSTLIVPGNATATANNIAAHQLLFRLGIVADLFCGTILIFLVLALYRLLKGVDQNRAVLMVIIGGVIPATIDFLNVLNDAAALTLVRGADFLSVFEKPQRDALAMLFLHLHRQEIVAAEILWGLWLFPLAILVYRSGFLPRFLGVWLIINGFSYLALSFTGLLLPQYEHMLSNITFPAILGEMAIMLWLLIKGAKPQPLDSAALSAAG
jgi:hypothetical protein